MMIPFNNARNIRQIIIQNSLQNRGRLVIHIEEIETDFVTVYLI